MRHSRENRGSGSTFPRRNRGVYQEKRESERSEQPERSEQAGPSRRLPDWARMTAAAAIIAGITLLLQGLGRSSEAFAYAYSTTVYRFLVAALGRIMSLFPFSFTEIGLYVLIILGITGLVRVIGRMVRKQLTVGQGAGRIAATTLLAASILFLAFTLGGGINYYRTAFSSEAGFLIEESSREQLEALCELLVQEINEAAESIETDEEGLLVLPDHLGELAKSAMYSLGDSYPQLDGYYPDPKPILISRILSVQKIQGIYSPFTVEANYNQEMPAVDTPVTICHELSHLRGYMREEEANFIAYLACSRSESAAFRYSGAILAWIYCSNALYRDGAVEQYWESYGQLCETARLDLAARSVFWKQFDGKVAEVSNQVNDTYLKLNKQEDGVKSYGRMVDLLLALYKEEIS